MKIEDIIKQTEGRRLEFKEKPPTKAELNKTIIAFANDAGGVYAKTRWEYPVKTIREAIRNAVVHRDYSLLGKDIKIAIYDDMVEITILEIANQLNKTTRAIEMAIAKLKRQNKLKRIDPDKGGHWEVIE